MLIALGVTGGIGAYKSVEVVRGLTATAQAEAETSVTQKDASNSGL